MTRLILIRHGESKGNAQRAFLGHTNWDVTEKGRAQAETTAAFLKNEKIDVIYSSDLIRAYSTAKPIAEDRGLKINTSEKLREIYAGKWEGKHIAEIIAEFPDTYAVWRTDTMKAVCDGGESVLGLQERIKREVLRILEENKGKTVCITTHATSIGVFIDYLHRELKDPDYTAFRWVTNASVTMVDFFDDGSFKIVKESEDRHLAHIPAEPYRED